MKKKGFTLVELLIVMAILLMMATMMVGTLNSVGIFNKARDARRKKDIGRIKIAFEDYYNDKSCYPSPTIVSNLMLATNCGTGVFKPWLPSWPCDPNGTPYQIATDAFGVNACAKWFKVLTKLENKSDADIPVGWNQGDGWEYYTLGGSATSATANFGVSSPNVVWSDVRIDPECEAYSGCYYRPDIGLCNSITGCVGPNCYLGLCQDKCRMECCGSGCE